MTRRFVYITGSRADYSPLYPVIRLLDCWPIRMQGLFENDKHILTEIQRLSSDPRTKPDVVLLLGDRYETLTAAQVATYLCLPIAHFCGGEETLGAIDNQIRHAITKLAYWHFPACELYAQRIIQMGEPPERIFPLGNPSMDNLADIGEPKTSVAGEFALVSYHPETLGRPVREQISQLLEHLDTLREEGLSLVISASNADAGGEEISLALQTYSTKHKCHYDTTYGWQEWNALMKKAKFLVGNSSSFIMDGLTLGKHIIMLGDRQKGRWEEAKAMFAKERYPFGKPGKVAPEIASKLMTLPLPTDIRKEFRWQPAPVARDSLQ